MKLVVALVSSAAVLAAAAPALADQCAWTNARQAAAAKVILKKNLRWASFCKPCGERVPRGPFAVQLVQQVAPQRGYVETYLNRQPIDLAYTYVETRPGSNVYQNLAVLSKCPASDVPATVSFKVKPAVGQTGQKR